MLATFTANLAAFLTVERMKVRHQDFRRYPERLTAFSFAVTRRIPRAARQAEPNQLHGREGQRHPPLLHQHEKSGRHSLPDVERVDVKRVQRPIAVSSLGLPDQGTIRAYPSRDRTDRARPEPFSRYPEGE